MNSVEKSEDVVPNNKDDSNKSSTRPEDDNDPGESINQNIERFEKESTDMNLSGEKSVIFIDDKNTSSAEIDGSNGSSERNVDLISKNKYTFDIKNIVNTTVESVKCMDEGSDSQDEELLLRWDEDDNEENTEMKCNQTITDGEDENEEVVKPSGSLETGNRGDIIMSIDQDVTNEVLSKAIVCCNENLVKSSNIETVGSEIQYLTDIKSTEDNITDESCHGKDKEAMNAIDEGSMNTKTTKKLDCVENMDVDEELPDNKNDVNVKSVVKEYALKSDISKSIKDNNTQGQNEPVKDMTVMVTDESNFENAKITTVFCNTDKIIDNSIVKGKINLELDLSCQDTVVPKTVEVTDITNANINLTLPTETITEDITENNDIISFIIDSHKDISDDIKKEVISSLDSNDLNLSVTPEIKTDHLIKKPNIMLDIPIQELIDNDLNLDRDNSLNMEIQLLKTADDDFHQDDDSQDSSNPSVDNIILRLEKEDVLESHIDEKNVISTNSKVNNVNVKSKIEENIIAISNKNIELQDISKDRVIVSDLNNIQTSIEQIVIDKEPTELTLENSPISDIPHTQSGVISKEIKVVNKLCKYYYYYDDTDAQSTDFDSSKEVNKSKYEISPEKKGSEITLINKISESVATEASAITKVVDQPEKEVSSEQQNRCDQLIHNTTKIVMPEISPLKEGVNTSEIEVFHDEPSIEVEKIDHGTEVQSIEGNESGGIEKISEVIRKSYNNENSFIVDSPKDTQTEMKDVIKSLDSYDFNLPLTPERKADQDLHKRDVMLEIPTQELIDMDEEVSETTVTEKMCEKAVSDEQNMKILTATKPTSSNYTVPQTFPPTNKNNYNTSSEKLTSEAIRHSTIEKVLAPSEKVLTKNNSSFNTEVIPSISTNVTSNSEVNTSLQTTCEVTLTISNDPPTNIENIKTLVEPTSIVKSLFASTKVLTSISEVSTSVSEVPPSVSEDLSLVLPSTSATVPEKDINVVSSASEAVVSDIEVVSSTSESLPTTCKDLTVASGVVPLETVTSTSAFAISTFEAKPFISEPELSTSDVVSSVIQPSPPIIDTDISEETLEIQDSLGLLAESSRVMDYDEDVDDDECDDDEDIDIDDESSNHMTAEHSEDSSAPHSENELQKESVSVPVVATRKEDMQIDESTNLIMAEHSEDSVLHSEDKSKKDGIPAAEDATEKENIQSNDKDDEIDITEDIMTDNTVEPIQELVSTENELKSDQKNENQLDVSTNMSTTEAEVPAKKRKIEEVEKTVEDKSPEERKQSPSKTKNLIISKPSHVFNIVELEESSSEDDVQEATPTDQKSTPLAKDVMTSVTETTEADSEVMVTEETDDTKLKPDEAITDKESGSTLVLPGVKVAQETPDSFQPSTELEIFNLDSEDEENKEEPKTEQPQDESPVKQHWSNKCINKTCKGVSHVYYKADLSVVAHYDAARKKRSMVCEMCMQEFLRSRQRLIEGVKNLTPLLELDIGKYSEDCVEISDSESEEEMEPIEQEKELIGETVAQLLEGSLAQMLNGVWKKFHMDARIDEAVKLLNEDFEKLNAEDEELKLMLAQCQLGTDTLRNELYATFEPKPKLLPPIVVYDTPTKFYSCYESNLPESTIESEIVEQTPKRFRGRSVIPLGYTPLNADPPKGTQENVQDQVPVPSIPATANLEQPTKIEEDKDVSVVQLSAEVAPPDLPPNGEVTRPQIKVGVNVYAVRNAFGAWLKARILELTPRGTKGMQYTICRVKFETTSKNLCKVLSARNLAYEEPSDVRLTIGTRVIALFKDSANDGKRESFYSGIVAEVPNPVNNYRYLVFFDDGYAQYVLHKDTRIVCESSPVVWDEVHPFSREFVKKYLLAYPERPMVRLHAGQSLKTEWNGKWWASKVIKVDASLVQVHFEEDNRTEWIYRGSTRLAPLYLELQAAERHRNRPLPRSKAQPRTNMPYVEYTRSDELNTNKEAQIQAQQREQEEIRRQRAVARKSTTAIAAPAHQPSNNVETPVTTRVVYYTPKNAVKPYKMVPHNCSTKCKRSDVLGLKELRTYNPLAKPLLSGWERQILRYKGQREVMYRAPCGRRLRNMHELHTYLRVIQSEMPVDLFDFHPNTHCLAEFVITKCLVGKKDLSHGKENVPVPCVNTQDETLPEFCSYNTERTPTAGVPLNLDPEFLCGCDCTDDCEDKSKCACWKMTLEGAKTIGLEGPNIGYVYKRLPEPLSSGIYECNSRCKCKSTCLNRVAQHPLQLKLQVFKTMNRGWGIRALNDVPAGAFLCVYAGNLLTDATANLDGLNEGDEYLAELDYIEVLEQMKEGYEEDIPKADKKLDKKELNKESSEEEVSTEEEDPCTDDKQDGDFTPGVAHWAYGNVENKKTLRKRQKAEKKEKDKNSKEANQDDDCITISDDEEVREPSRFTAQAGMGANEFVSKYRSVRAHFGKDEACYIMDAKVQGNIGRYLNHSCSPNVFVQNVFVDTHDPRFPWVAFFAQCHIRAGTELTWNYNYDVGSVPGKVLYCHCGAPNCRGRLL